MRTAEQIYNKYKIFLSAVSHGEALNAIRLIQEEAYNQAIRDTIDIIEKYKEEVCIGVVNDIENLRK